MFPIFASLNCVCLQAYVKKSKRSESVVVPGQIPMSELLCPCGKLKHCLKPKKLETERDAHGELMVSEENLPGEIRVENLGGAAVNSMNYFFYVIN